MHWVKCRSHSGRWSQMSCRYVHPATRLRSVWHTNVHMATAKIEHGMHYEVNQRAQQRVQFASQDGDAGTCSVVCAFHTQASGINLTNYLHYYARKH